MKVDFRKLHFSHFRKPKIGRFFPPQPPRKFDTFSSFTFVENPYSNSQSINVAFFSRCHVIIRDLDRLAHRAKNVALGEDLPCVFLFYGLEFRPQKILKMIFFAKNFHIFMKIHSFQLSLIDSVLSTQLNQIPG